MWYCNMVALFHTLPYRTILYHTVPYRTILYHTVPYCTILYHTVPYCTILYHTVPYSTILYHTVPYSAMNQEGSWLIQFFLLHMQCHHSQSPSVWYAAPSIPPQTLQHLMRPQRTLSTVLVNTFWQPPAIPQQATSPF